MRKFWNDTFNPPSLGSKTETVIGTLNPIMWDRRGKIKKFSIYSYEDEDIIIEGFRNRAKLKNLLNKKVEAKGIIRVNEDGEKLIKLTNIRELTGPSSPGLNITPSLATGVWNEEFSVSIPKHYGFSQYENLQAGRWEAC